jgi:putative OPT family oligopeptide transporter
MWGAFSKGFKELFESRRKHSEEEIQIIRTDRDIRMFGVVIILLITLVGLLLYFWGSVLSSQPKPFTLALIALLVTFVLAFLFNSVSARAIATIGTTPISGMTMMTLVIACLLLMKAGLSGPGGMLSALLIGGVVCTALSMSGSLVTQFKIGYWLGSTPRWIEYGNIIGSIVAAIVTSFVIIMLSQVYGFAPSAAHPNPLPAPQANAMAAVISGIMISAKAPWFLYAIGALIAFVMEMVGVSPLAFALGMYLPLPLTVPMLTGALISHAVKKSTKDIKLSERRNARGTLIASGLIAGGALMGVIGAFLQWIGVEVIHNEFLPDFKNIGSIGNWIGLLMLGLLCGYIYFDSIRGNHDNSKPTDQYE